MKVNSDFFFKSFIISLIIFALIAAIIIVNLYVNNVAIEPQKRASNILIGITHNGDLLSMTLVHCDPKDNSVTLLQIPDNTIISDGTVLQNLYQSHKPLELIKFIQDMTGARVNRYIFFSTDTLSSLIDSTGNFQYLVRYPFVHSGNEYSGNIYMTGEIAKAMFTYPKYDMTKVSLSAIGESFLHNVLSSYSNLNDMQKFDNEIKSIFTRYRVNTNLSDSELTGYCEFFSKFSSLEQLSVAIDGEYLATSSNLYFVPTNNKVSKNIFK